MSPQIYFFQFIIALADPHNYFQTAVLLTMTWCCIIKARNHEPKISIGRFTQGIKGKYFNALRFI